MTKLNRILALLGLVATLFCAGCEEPNQSTSIEFRVPVVTEAVTQKTIEEVIKTAGTLRAPESITLTVMTTGLLDVSSGKQGRLAEGDFVRAGTVIANITGEDVRLAAKMTLAKQRRDAALERLTAITTLFERDMVSANDVANAKTTYEDARQAFETAVHTQNRNKIVTPIDGVILKLARNNGQPMADGQLVNQGQLIAEVAALNPLVVDVDLVSKDIAKVVTGQEARAQYHAWDDRVFPGKVLRIAPTVDESTRALRTEIQLNNDDELLKPGMFVEVSLIVERKVDVPVIPRRALTQRGGKRVVFVVDTQRAEQRIVETGLSDGEFVEVVEGLAVGEQVVVVGLETLADQMPVRASTQ